MPSGMRTPSIEHRACSAPEIAIPAASIRYGSSRRGAEGDDVASDPATIVPNERAADTSKSTAS
eukprot:scaffold124911_cov36-Tisochrysis_lutea.AAC.3